MNETPILFSTPMIQAIIADRKTETRRTRRLDLINKNPDDWELISLTLKNQYNKLRASFKNRKINERFDLESPYGSPGDLLWVRETYYDCNKPIDNPYYKPYYIYFADNKGTDDWRVKDKEIKWKPSIHMPKATARIWLKVTDIKVERLQNITEESAISEGVLKRNNAEFWDYINGFFRKDILPTYSFKSLWKYINGEDSWKANPWVWVVKFEVVSKNGKPFINL